MQRAFVLFYAAVISVGVLNANAATVLNRVIGSSVADKTCAGVHAKADFPSSPPFGPRADATRFEAANTVGTVINVDGGLMRLRLQDRVYTFRLSDRAVPSAIVYGGTEIDAPRSGGRDCI